MSDKRAMISGNKQAQQREYTLEIDARVEDLAGNNLRGSFESGIDDNYPGALSIVSRSFTIN